MGARELFTSQMTPAEAHFTFVEFTAGVVVDILVSSVRIISSTRFRCLFCQAHASGPPMLAKLAAARRPISTRRRWLDNRLPGSVKSQVASLDTEEQC